MSFCIVQDHPSILQYVEALQAKHGHELGFLPRAVFQREKEEGRLFLGLLNGEPCGYILVGTGYKGVLRRWQVCIQYDARRRLYGAMLVAKAEEFGLEKGCTLSVVRCASDLEANKFWESLGYVLVGTEKGGRTRGRLIYIWEKPLFPSIRATHWANGRPRVYATNAERQAAYRARLVTKHHRTVGTTTEESARGCFVTYK
jgi:GNAT superfamily N-acetyltransferase